MNQPHALLVDDCNESRLLIRLILTPRGYVITEAEDAAEASDLLKTNHFDLIVLDIAMVGIDGFTIAEQIRKGLHGPFNMDTYIVGCSGLYLNKRNLSREATGMDLFFNKPLESVRKFADKIDTLLGRAAC
ncbi:response regulator [Cerasicoccus frondis]|uniref:response regulator n=1 Tax=Cerasicoccus frondis TaxID=490090 RepID=UPI0028525A20|nr:response regulator [Cerasicoccus frondis]